jgi:hypothetical protein
LTFISNQSEKYARTLSDGVVPVTVQNMPIILKGTKVFETTYKTNWVFSVCNAELRHFVNKQCTAAEGNYVKV